MRWLGPMLHLIFPPMNDPAGRELAALVDERREHVAAISVTRQRLEQIAADPMAATLEAMIEDL